MAILTESEYAVLDVPSYSVLSKIKHHPADIDKVIKNEGIDIGSYLDTKLFSPEQLESKFALIDVNLGEKPQQIAELLLNEEEITDEKLVAAAGTVQYQSNYKRETLLKKLKEELNIPGYVDLLKRSKGKVIFDAEAKFKADTCFNSLKNDPFLAPIFNKTLKNTIFLHQVPCTGVVDNAPVKSKLDIVAITFGERGIEITPVDMKYSSRLTTFEDDILQYGYYIQAELYRDIISQNIEDLVMFAYNKIITSDSMFGYNATESSFVEYVKEARIDVNGLHGVPVEVYPFEFIIANERYSPLRLRYLPNHKPLEDFVANGKKYRNVISLLQDYTYYKTVNRFTHPREVLIQGYKDAVV